MTLTATPNPALQPFLDRVSRLVHEHPVVTGNDYTRWFARGDASLDEVRHLTVQFSVFSHLFIEAQLRKVINAGSLDTYRAGKEILLNELGVVFRSERAAAAEGVDPALVSTEGTVDGGRFRFGAAHFEWLLRFGRPLDLGFADLGKRRHGTLATLFFCDELLRVYGSEDPSIAEGASFAVEHWAAAGFWKELIQGLEAFKARECPDLPLAFWTWHDKVEDQHAAHTDDELVEAFHAAGFDGERFPYPSIEDVDLGARLVAGGARIVLDPTIQGTHRKAWTLRSMIQTDFARRGVPWVGLLLRSGEWGGRRRAGGGSLGTRPAASAGAGSTALNLGWRHRVSAGACATGVAGLLLRRPATVLAALLVLLVANRDFYALLARRRGVVEAVAGVGLHAVHHLTALAAVPAGVAVHLRDRRCNHDHRSRCGSRTAAVYGPELTITGGTGGERTSADRTVAATATRGGPAPDHERGAS